MTRTNWSAQSQRLWDYLANRPNEDIPQPELNRAAAGAGGVYVNSFTKRLSECRKRAQAAGGDVIKSRDEWVEGQRRTHYRYLPPAPICNHFWSIPDKSAIIECLWCGLKTP